MFLLVFLFYHLFVAIVAVQVTITPDCSMANTELNCKCKPDDPVREYGDRFMYELLDQFKDNNNLHKVQKLVLSNCNVPFKFNVDLRTLKEVSYDDGPRLLSLHEIMIKNCSPVSVYFEGGLLNGDLNVTFMNIHGHNGLGSVVLKGGVNYCSKSCQTTVPDRTGPPSKWTSCNDCVPSNIRFSFIKVDHVYLQHFGIASYEDFKEEGHAILHAERVQTFRIDDPFLSNVEVESIEAKECSLRSKYQRNPYTDVVVDCNSFDHWPGNDSLLQSLGAGYIVLIILICLGVLGCFSLVYKKYKKEERQEVNQDETICS